LQKEEKLRKYMQPEKDLRALLRIFETYTEYVVFLNKIHKQYLAFSAINKKTNYTVLSLYLVNFLLFYSLVKMSKGLSNVCL